MSNRREEDRKKLAVLSSPRCNVVLCDSRFNSIVTRWAASISIDKAEARIGGDAAITG